MIGSVEIGKIQGEICSRVFYSKDTITEQPSDFKINKVQVVITDEEYRDNHGDDEKRAEIVIYLPPKELEDSNIGFKEFAEKERREKLKNAIIEQVQGKLSEEQINTILDSVPYDTEIVVTSSPYDLANESIEVSTSSEYEGDDSYDTEQKISIIDGDVKPGSEKGKTFSGALEVNNDIEYENPDFTLNQLQIINVNRVDSTYNYGGTEEITNRTIIYIPDEEILKEGFSGLKSYKEVIELIASKGDEASLEGIDQELKVIQNGRNIENKILLDGELEQDDN